MWTIEEVPGIMAILEPVASHNGFLVSAYGSTMRKGQGRDLDLIFVQKRCGVLAQWLLRDVADALQAHVECDEQSLFAELCALLRMRDGRLVDIQIRLSKCGPQDAMDMYEGNYASRPTALR